MSNSGSEALEPLFHSAQNPISCSDQTVPVKHLHLCGGLERRLLKLCFTNKSFPLAIRQTHCKRDKEKKKTSRITQIHQKGEYTIMLSQRTSQIFGKLSHWTISTMCSLSYPKFCFERIKLLNVVLIQFCPQWWEAKINKRYVLGAMLEEQRLIGSQAYNGLPIGPEVVRSRLSILWHWRSLKN